MANIWTLRESLSPPLRAQVEPKLKMLYRIWTSEQGDGSPLFRTREDENKASRLAPLLWSKKGPSRGKTGLRSPDWGHRSRCWALLIQGEGSAIHKASSSWLCFPSTKISKNFVLSIFQNPLSQIQVLFEACGEAREMQSSVIIINGAQNHCCAQWCFAGAGDCFCRLAESHHHECFRI